MSTDPLPADAERILSAAANRIVPADEFPSAGECGAAAYVARLLGRELADRRDEMLTGLSRLDSASHLAHGCAFAEAMPEQQGALLSAAESDPASAPFFAWLVELVTESYYADPANGGNAGAVSWRMVGYDPRLPAREAAGLERRP